MDSNEPKYQFGPLYREIVLVRVGRPPIRYDKSTSDVYGQAGVRRFQSGGGWQHLKHVLLLEYRNYTVPASKRKFILGCIV